MRRVFLIPRATQQPAASIPLLLLLTFSTMAGLLLYCCSGVSLVVFWGE
jgi:hypothetical protein